MATRFVVSVSLCAVLLLIEGVVAVTFSMRLVHRFSEELKAVRVSRNGEAAGWRWPERRSLEYYQMLVSSDVQRQKMKLASQHQFLFPSEGSKAMSFGNDWGWLHYSWIDIGMPNVSFLVALDTGSDLLWVPCDCEQCAPLSASNYDSLERDLNEYNPSLSSTSKHLSCSHQLCDLGPSCRSPKQPCIYTVNYITANTSSSGLLVEDILHLASSSDDASSKSVQAPVIIGCGRKQSGGYLSGVAPDGLMGLGLGEISVPSFLAKSGLIQNSFSLCFDDDEDNSGRIFFGDLGISTQQTTPFLPLNGKYTTYIVGVEACCIGTTCLEETSFETLVDSGTSFTYLPKEAYERVVKEFDRLVNATRTSSEGLPWEYCYKSSSHEFPKIPSVTLKFQMNNSFVVHNPVFVISVNQGVAEFCLAIESADVPTIGQNYMTGYRMVFDRENLKLGWSRSNCQDLSDSKRMPLTPPPKGGPPNQLPTSEQQSTPGGNAVAPALAGRTPTKPSAASTLLMSLQLCSVKLLVVPLLLHQLVLAS